MHNASLKIVTFVSCAAAYPLTAMAQRAIVPRRQLEASSDSVRIQAFYELQSHAMRHQAQSRLSRSSAPTPTMALAADARQDPELRTALVELLERENRKVISSPKGSLSETYLGGYYIDVVVTVARMQDPRAYRALLPAIGNGDVISTGIAAAGEQAVPEIIAILDTARGPTKRSGAAYTLGKISDHARESGVSATTMGRIRGALLKAIHNPTDFALRMSAIDALHAFDDGELRSEMESIAKEDDATSIRGNARIYPVREAAQRWLSTRDRH